MKRLARYVAALGVVLTLACGESSELDEGRDLSLAPAESLAVLNDAPMSDVESVSGDAKTLASLDQPAAPRPPAPRPSPRKLDAGTELTVIARDTIVAKDHTVGHPVTATIGTAVSDARGRTVIPAGAAFKGRLANIDRADSTFQGHMLIDFYEVSFGGSSYPIEATTTSVGTRTQGGGVSAGDAAKVGAGAVVGAIAGRLIGGNATGTAVGAAAGTAAGVGVAVATKGDKDVYLDAGAPITIVLTAPLVRP